MTVDDGDDLLETDMGPGRGVFVPATSTALVLNESAARIWDLARNGSTVEQVAVQVALECSVDVDTVRDAVVETVGTLVERGLLRADETT